MRPLLAAYRAGMVPDHVAYSQLLLPLDSVVEAAPANQIEVVTVRIQ